jgi:hypothetical protein
MTAEAAIRRQRPLEIHAAVAVQSFEIRSVQRFFEKIEGELIVVRRSHGKTAAIDRDAIADPDLLRDARRDDLKFRALRLRLERHDASHFFNQAGKHKSERSKQLNISRPRRRQFARPRVGLTTASECAGMRRGFSSNFFRQARESLLEQKLRAGRIRGLES